MHNFEQIKYLLLAVKDSGHYPIAEFDLKDSQTISSSNFIIKENLVEVLDLMSGEWYPLGNEMNIDGKGTKILGSAHRLTERGDIVLKKLINE